MPYLPKDNRGGRKSEDEDSERLRQARLDIEETKRREAEQRAQQEAEERKRKQ